MNELNHATTAELEAGLDFIRRSPKDGGTLELIVRRPQVNERETMDEATLELAKGWQVTIGNRAAAPARRTARRIPKCRSR